VDSLKEYRVLVVDDSPGWRELLSLTLQDYDVTSVGGVGDALRALALSGDKSFDIAVVDKSLVPENPKDESGLDLAREIKSICSRCQIIILTGFEDVSSAVTAFKDVEVFHYLRKVPPGGQGFDNDELRNTVYRAILAAREAKSITKPSEVHRPKREAITVLHLSDLHFGEHHRFVQDRNYPSQDAPTLEKALSTSLDANGKHPDIVVVSGDLTQTGDWGEFVQARDCLDELRAYLKLDWTQFIIVPGNHDVRWPKQEDDSDGNNQNMLAEYRGFYELLYLRRPITGAPLCRVEVFRYRHKPDVAVVGLDSCVIERPSTAGVGYVGTTQLANAMSKLDEMLGEDSACVKIAVLHHHLVPVAYLENLPDKEKEFSLVVDATRILARLQEKGFALVLHGHQHQPFCAEIRFPHLKGHRSKPMAIIGMGSTGIEPIPERVGGTRNNHYGILEISQFSTDAPLQVDVSWYRAAGNEPEETFEPHEEFSLAL
jgi:ActR/RegA family two-component response regulator/predicted phosphodiesterase